MAESAPSSRPFTSKPVAADVIMLFGRKVFAVAVWVLGLSLVHLNSGAPDVSTASAVTAATLSMQSTRDAAAFQQLVRSYRTGRAEDAVSALATWPVDQLAASAQTATATLSSSDRMAAAILEAEVARALLAVHRLKDAQAVIEGALTVLHDAGRAPFGDQLGEEPKRSWYYAVASTLVGSHQTTEASALLEIALKEFHDDPLLMVARGTISESRWNVTMLGNGHSIGRTENLMTFQGRATADYVRALRMRPNLTVAKLRLGQLYAEAGEDRKAEPFLQAVVAGRATDNEQYLAHLLLGRIAAKEHRLEAADAEYHKAYTIGRYQAACIALAQLGEILDQRAQPAGTADDCLRESERDDPWLYWRTKADPDALPHLRAEARGE
jgi:tetratricopeptide (TPR) repeat protein